MKRRVEGVTVIAGCIAALIGMALVSQGALWQRRQTRQAACQSQLKQILLGTMQYVRDYDEVMPPAQGWTRALSPYARGTGLFQCPERGTAPQGYAYHSGAGLTNISAFEKPDKMILVFDSASSSEDASDAGSSLPRPIRHPRGNNFAFADGHAKAGLQPNFLYGYDAEFRRLNRLAAQDRSRYWKIIEARSAARQMESGGQH